MATARDSAIYAALFTNQYLGDARKYDGRVVPLPFELTLVSTTTGDSYRLTQIPANARVVSLTCTTNGLGASAGTGITLKIGDSGDDDRYMAASDFDVVNAQGYLAYAGAGYTPTSATIVIATMTGTAVAGTIVKGCLFVIPGA